jgi:ATP adenylyltransferase/5',5'''-P-1,P-4-tetraphosphate phosphorylase II
LYVFSTIKKTSKNTKTLDEKHEKIASPKTEVKPHLLVGPMNKTTTLFYNQTPYY